MFKTAVYFRYSAVLSVFFDNGIPDFGCLCLAFLSWSAFFRLYRFEGFLIESQKKSLSGFMGLCH